MLYTVRRLNRSSKGSSSPVPLLVSSPMQRLDPPMKCVICGYPILWKESRVMDYGKLVHDECFLTKRKETEVNPPMND